MKNFGAVVRATLLMLLFNCVGLCGIGEYKLLKGLGIAALAVHFLVFLFIPQLHSRSERLSPRLKRLSDGAYTLGLGRFLLWAELPVIILLAVFGGLSVTRNILNGVIAYLFLFVLNIVSVGRLAVSSKQIKPTHYVLLICTWYIPVVNSLVLKKLHRIARTEYRVEQAKEDLNDMRAENQVCRTKYPILMVHGIFFRDWQLFNYWGRIPKELVRNGAEVFYGCQQSANTIERSANEIAAQIMNIIEETGAEKINIIAHSKGGLDSRYAISRLGMDKYVASLTTINTPHRGVKWVDEALKKIPKNIQASVDKKYNSLFSKLGDKDPHFLLGVNELTYASCERFNAETPDAPGVRYHSIMSRMASPKSAGFPLNFGYRLGKKYDAQGNDGLVGVESALYWKNSSMIPDTKKRGISHGDMIDLMRENINDFDVREFYVGIVKELKESGL